MKIPSSLLLLATVSVAAMLVGVIEAPAQQLSAEVSGGVTVPTAGLSDHRGPGERFTAGLRYDFRDSPWAVRTETAWSRLHGPPQDEDGFPSWQRGDLRSLAVSVSVLRSLGGGDLRPYLALGASGYRMQIEGVSRNPYGTVPGVFGGVGVAREMGPWRLFVETHAKIILSDYGSREWSPGVQFPVGVGVGRSFDTPDFDRFQRPEADLVSWAPDRSRLLYLPSGRGVGRGAVHASLSGLWTPYTAGGLVQEEVVFMRPSVAVGLTDWLSVHGGFWPQRIPDQEFGDRPVHQDGQLYGGMEFTVPLENWALSAGGQLTHPRRSDFGRTISESVAYAVMYRERGSGGYSAGLGWRGYPSGGDQGGWTGGGFLTGGAHQRLLPNLEGVAEAGLGEGGLSVRPGLRTGVAGLSVEASVACAVGLGASCMGPNITAAYHLDLTRRR